MRLLTLILIACPGNSDSDKRADSGWRPDSPHSTSETNDVDTSGNVDSEDTTSGTDDTDDCRSRYWFADVDLDGYGDPNTAVRACEPPEGTVETRTDCDDTRADVFPGATETCGDGAYNDCNDDHGEDAWALCVTTETFSLAMSDAKIIGESEGDLAGIWVDAAGDVNGDGRMDLLIGAQYRDAGSMYVVLGPVSGTVDLSTAIGEIQGESVDAPARGDIASAGDMNDDGALDYVMGAPSPGIDGAYVVLGPLSGDVNLTSADALWAFTDAEEPYMGSTKTAFAVVGLGDTNEDGWDDILVGAPGVNGIDGEESELGSCPSEDGASSEHMYDAGAAYLIAGPTSGRHAFTEAYAAFNGEDGQDYAGYAAANAGDVNGDSVDDILVGAPQNCEAGPRAGAAYLIYPPVEGELSLADADAKLIATFSEDNAGMEVNAAGDVNGDGHPDVLVGASAPMYGDAADGRGSVYLVEGPFTADTSLSAAKATIIGEAEWDYLGESASPAGDINLDGHDDILVGAYLQDAGGENAGAAYLIYGPISGAHPLSVSVKLYGPTSNDVAGGQATGVGDTNADGYPDLLIGAAGDDEGGTSAGAAYVVLGGGAILSSLGSW